MGEAARAEVAALAAEGQIFAAHDRAMAALAAGATDDWLAQHAVLTLAQTGALGPALALFHRLGLDRRRDLELAGLGARLRKDVALASREPADAARAFAAAFALWRRSTDPWPGVNAAAMALLAGRKRLSRRLAARLLHLPDRGDYWSAATAAEAALLAGEEDRAARLLVEAAARGAEDLRARASTARQLHWEIALLGADPRLVALLAIPMTAHFCGRIPPPGATATLPPAALAAALAGVGFAFGSLAAGGDIVLAEALLAHGARVTALLPFPPAAFEAASVAPAGAEWVARFRALLPRCDVEVLEPSPVDDLDFALVSRRAMGRVRLHAASLAAEAVQIAVVDAEEARSPAGTGADIATWRAAGGQTRRLVSPWPRRPPAAGAAPARRALAVLFGDLRGFGALDDAALARFYAAPMGALATAIEAGAPLYRNAWGDAVQLVLPDVAAACATAERLRRALPPVLLARCALPEGLVPRIALDFGALLAVFDAVQGVAKFAGRSMTRAARIEPVTPPGAIYATESFACELALARGAGHLAEYAGKVPTAKGFGTLPLYAVRPAPAAGAGENQDG